MRHRTATTRGIIAFGASLLLLTASAGAVGAARNEVFQIAIDFDNPGGTAEWVSSSSPLLCDEGLAYTDFHFGTGTPASRAGTFHLAKEIVCNDGTFWISVDAAANFVARNGTVGGWTVIKGSGTGAYEGLAGGGSIVGVNPDSGPIDLIDHYYGVLRR